MSNKRILAIGIAGVAMGLTSFGSVSVTSVNAQQRYPWNGLVDVVVTLEGSEDDISKAECSFVATNCATGAEVPVTSIIQKGVDAGSSATWTRRFVWNATNDVGTVKIDDLALTVNAEISLGGVQLWENGPYWAECNVGATKPEEYGYYFWWGDTVGYKRNADNNGWVSVRDGTSYSFSNCPTLGKDNSQLQSAGYIDSTGNLVAAHDAATAYLGAPWRMPTDAEFAALIRNCDTTWTTRGGVYGRLITGRGVYASKSIFLPAAGYDDCYGLTNTGHDGYYWSSTPDSGYSDSAWYLNSDSGSPFLLSGIRCFGQSVRPLRGFAKSAASRILASGVMTHLTLDCLTGVRASSADGENFRFDASWYENGEEARISDNGAVLTNGTSGVYTWVPELCSSTQHVFRLEILSAGRVVGVETAEFSCAEPTLEHATVITKPAVAPTCRLPGCTAEIRCSRCGEIVQAATEIPALGYIANVTARQIRPWRGLVEIGYELMEDVVLVDTNKVIVQTVTVHDREHDVQYEARTFTRAPTFEKGQHKLVWDAKADDVSFASTSVVFSVSLQEKDPVPRYQVIDLSGGPSATSYPVTGLSSVPAGGWSDEYKTTKLVLRRIEAGSFIMGEDQTDESHRVTLTKPFYIGVLELTQRQWELVMGSNPSYFSGNPMRPVERVSYNMIRGTSLGSQWPTNNQVDADSFIGKLRGKTGINFDLPTEAQWEYACRTGTTTTYSYGNDVDGTYMWYRDNSQSSTQNTGTKLPNSWGLYDMHGNVWEWCVDWRGSLTYGSDPKGASSGSKRIARGGGWSHLSNYSTAFRWNDYVPSGEYDNVGLRLFCSLSE